MLKSLVLTIVAALVLPVWAQTYTPHKGETDLKLEIEGRGSVYIKLFTQDAPKTTERIIKLVKEGFYSGQRFHRVEKNPKPYLVQIGDPASKEGDLNDPKMGQGGSGVHIQLENSGHQNVEGAVALAHPVDDENGGDSQFFISLSANKFLDGHDAVFGQVVSGMDVVKSIELGDRLKSATIVTGQ
jgi:cyclophilin family peptidyl-prolyl cis-trans isomerase